MNSLRLKQIENWLIYILVATMPVFLLPIFGNPFITSKLIFLAVILIALVLVKALRNISAKTSGLVFATSPIDLPVFLLTIAYVASGYFVTPNRMEAFWLPGTASFVIAGALLYLFIHQLSEKAKEGVRLGLVVASGLTSLFYIISISGLLKNTSLPAYVKADSFTPLGSILAVAIFLIAVAPLVIDFIARHENTAIRAMSGVVLGLSILAALVSVVQLTKSTSPLTPSHAISWSVASDSLKASPLLGAGPGNYLSAFSKFIPVSYNATESWTVRFTNASNFYLTAVTETGLFGLAALIILGLAVYRRIRTIQSEAPLANYAPFIVVALALALFPATPVIILLFFILLALVGRTKVTHLFAPHAADEASSDGKAIMLIASIPAVALALFIGALVLQSARAEYLYTKALTAISNQQANTAYETLKQAIALTPYSDRFHTTYAQLNLALANAIASKKDLSDEDKNTVGQLVQQAIREGRSAVTLNRERASNWANLGSIYNTVIPLAKGADQFAIQTYTQAIILDPTNPNTRIILGGVYYKLKRYEEAIDIYKFAVATKRDLANAHYNLAIAYRDNSQFDRALGELNAVLTLVKPESNDYQIAKKEIENVQSKAPKKNAPASGEDIKAPETASPSATLNPPIELPQDATPPNPDPTATPVVQGEQTTSPTPIPAQ